MKKFNQYEFSFTGKRAGAIGVSERFHAITVVADTEESAYIKLYNQYDHIMKVECVNKSQKDSNILNAYQSEIDPRYFHCTYKGGGAIWDSVLLEHVAPNDTGNNDSKEMHKELVKMIDFANGRA